MKHQFSAALLFCLLAQSVSAQTWSTGFFNRNDGYNPPFTPLSGAPTNAPSSQQWKTTDPYIPNNPLDPLDGGIGETSALQFFTGWTFGASSNRNQSVLFGGYQADNGVLPGITNPVLYRNFTNTFGSAATTFSADFGILGPSAGDFPSNDTFGFSLNDTNGFSLAAFQFVPNSPSPTALDVRWVQNGTNVVTNGTTFNGFNIEYGALYRLTAVVVNDSVTLTLAGLTTQTSGTVVTNYVVGPAATIVNGGALSGGMSSSDFQQAGITWDLASGNNLEPGSNYMIVNQVSVVPEPSTVGLLALGLAAVGSVYLRRRRNS